jgi:hypothetical protein
VATAGGAGRSDLHITANLALDRGPAQCRHCPFEAEYTDDVTGMRVELPKTLRLLSHELRAPLGILQGYLRLLKDGRIERDDETKMFAMMLQETGRISALARQASELAHWHAGDAAAQPVDVSVQSIISRLAVTAGPLEIAAMAPEASAWKVSSVHETGLADALAALTVLARRETPDAPIGVALFPAAGTPASVTIAIGPSATVAAGRAGQTTGDKSLSLESGGHGLALLVAAAVLDAHAARLATTKDTVLVTLPLRGLA